MNGFVQVTLLIALDPLSDSFKNTSPRLTCIRLQRIPEILRVIVLTRNCSIVFISFPLCLSDFHHNTWKNTNRYSSGTPEHSTSSADNLHLLSDITRSGAYLWLWGIIISVSVERWFWAILIAYTTSTRTWLKCFVLWVRYFQTMVEEKGRRHHVFWGGGIENERG